ncbi:MAG: TolC family outer membrane protein [Marinibacterium sp.]|nr:TolC family outer membrane protein [Marinibacterium sp.]
MAGAAIGLAALTPGGAKSQSLADALVGAYNTSGLLEQNRALLRAADENVAVALSALRPIVSWTASATRSVADGDAVRFNLNPNSSQINLGLTAQWLLYDGGASRLSVSQAKEAVLATRQGLVSIEQQILLRAVIAFFGVIEQVETVDLRENNVRVLSEELRAAQDRFEVGEVTRTDVSQAEARLAAARSLLAVARGDLVSAQEEYFAAVGSRAGRLRAPSSLPTPPASIDAVKVQAVNAHPNVRQAQHLVASNEIAVSAQRASQRPTISLNSGLGFREDFDLDDADLQTGSIGVNLSQQIYSGGRQAAQIRQAQANRDASRANLLTVSEDIQQNAANALIALRAAEASLSATRTRITAAQVAFDGVREEATLGSRTTLDVLDAEQEVLDAQAARITDEATRAIAAYALLSAQGLLTAERLGLPVTIYDPSAYYNQVKNAPAGTSKRGRDLDRVLESLGKK